MSKSEKEYRLEYLWFRVRTIYNMIKFISFLKQMQKTSDENNIKSNGSDMIVDEGDGEEDPSICCNIKFSHIRLLWIILMSFVHWLNLLTTPVVMLWPEIFPSPSVVLWSIEIMFLIDIFRKCIDKKPKSSAEDAYEIFVEYLRSNMPIDIIALIP